MKQDFASRRAKKFVRYWSATKFWDCDDKSKIIKALECMIRTTRKQSFDEGTKWKKVA